MSEPLCWTVQELEAIINRRRAESPGDGITLSPAVATLAHVYARMILARQACITAPELSHEERAALA